MNYFHNSGRSERPKFSQDSVDCGARGNLNHQAMIGIASGQAGVRLFKARSSVAGHGGFSVRTFMPLTTMRRYRS
jgi:hypothetical protein